MAPGVSTATPLTRALLGFSVWLCFHAGAGAVELRVDYAGVIDCDAVAQWRQHAFLACHSVGDQLPARIDHAKRADAYVLRIDIGRKKLIYAVRLGGSRYSAAFGIRTDQTGNAYVVGTTQAPDFPVTPDAVRTTFGGGKSDAFLAMVSPDGRLLYSSFLGGEGAEEGTALDLDPATARVCAGGTTRSASFPGASQRFRSDYSRAFLTCLDLQNRTGLKSVVFGGTGDTLLSGLAFDSRSGIFAAGATRAADFPLMKPVQRQLHGPADAFVSHFDASSLQPTFSTYFGGSGEDVAWSVAAGREGEAFIAGTTNSPDLPASRAAFQPFLRGGKDAFVARFRRNGKPEVTYFGGTADDAAGAECGGCVGASIAAGGDSVWIAGYTKSGDLPVRNQTSPSPVTAGVQHAFIAALTPSLTRLCFGSYVGTPGDALEGVSTSKRHRLLASGLSYSTDLSSHFLIDPESAITLRLNGRSAHAVIVSANVANVCR